MKKILIVLTVVLSGGSLFGGAYTLSPTGSKSYSHTARGGSSQDWHSYTVEVPAGMTATVSCAIDSSTLSKTADSGSAQWYLNGSSYNLYQNSPVLTSTGTLSIKVTAKPAVSWTEIPIIGYLNNGMPHYGHYIYHYYTTYYYEVSYTISVSYSGGEKPKPTPTPTPTPTPAPTPTPTVKPDLKPTSLVVATSPNATSTVNSFKDTDSIYVSWSGMCSGGAVSTTFKSRLYVDNVLKMTWTTDGVSNGGGFNAKGSNACSLGKLSSGTHVVKIVVDDASNVSESSESNNAMSQTISVSASTYTVALNKLGGTGGSSSARPTYGKAMPSISVPTRTGYTFGGYYTTTTGTGTRYYDSNGNSTHVWDRASNSATLYAYWIPNGYTVSLNRNGGSGGSTSSYVRYGKAMPSISVPTRTGYTFGGYYTTTTGTGTRYYDSNGNSAHVWDRASNSATLYAYWISNGYTVSFNKHGGSGGDSAKYVRFGQSLPHVAIPSKSGYKFAGYSMTTSLSSGTRYWDSNGNSLRVWDRASNSATLHAIWQPQAGRAYSVGLEPHNGGARQWVTAYYGRPMPHVTPLKRTGYTFAGYGTESYGKGIRYYDSNGNSLRNWDRDSTAAVLHAYWIPNKYTLTLAPNGALFSVRKLTVTYGQPMPAISALPAWAGKQFAGYWSTTRGVGVKYYNADGSSAHVWDHPSNNCTIYAYWTDPPRTLAEAVGASSLTFTSGGNAGWIIKPSDGTGGQPCIRSGVISRYQSSWVETVVRGSSVSFSCKVDSEANYDKLHFYIDGVEQFAISGQSGLWDGRSYPLSAGWAHTLRWEYTKDVSNDVGEDCAWLDNLVVK